jgi:NagD protein
MMRLALNYMDAHSENSIMVGDRMDTDVVAGITGGLETILVLSGVTDEHMLHKFPYQPKFVFESVADINPEELD